MTRLLAMPLPRTHTSSRTHKYRGVPGCMVSLSFTAISPHIVAFAATIAACQPSRSIDKPSQRLESRSHISNESNVVVLARVASEFAQWRVKGRNARAERELRRGLADAPPVAGQHDAKHRG
eukprot:scaffold45461_cov62-Phaeocystis_antarctica.AAC.4